MHRKWIAVRTSAGLAVAGSLATLALGLLMPVSMALAPPPVGPTAPPFPMMAIGIVMAVVFAAFSGWGIVTAVGIFRRRGWARISIVLFAVLLTIMGAGGSVAALFMQLPAQEGLDPRIMTAVRWGMAAFYMVLTGIGVWWLLLFNRKTTKEYFAGSDVPERPGTRPVSISVIGWYLVISSVMMAAAAVVKVPAFLLGTVITGWGALATYSVFTVAQIYLGTGILHLQEQARMGGIAYFCFGALNSLLTMLPPGWESKMQAMQRAMPKIFPAGIPVRMPEPAWVFGLMGAATVAIPIWFLVRQRSAFARAQAPPSSD